MKNAVIVIPFHLPWDWSADFMSQTAKILAQNNTVVCLLMTEPVFFRTIFVEAVRGRIVKKWSRQLWLMRPVHFIPFGQFTIVQKINTYLNLFRVKAFVWKLSYRQRYNKKLLWIFSPQFGPNLHIFSRSYVSLYDCVDYVWDPIPIVNNAIRKQENTLIQSVNFMFVNSHVLYDVHKDEKEDIFLVPLGFRLNSLKNILTKRRNPLPRNKPIIGFVGVINYRLDYSLLYTVASKNPQWNFVFCGQQETLVYGEIFHVRKAIDRLKKLSNVYFLENTASEEVPTVIQAFDVCTIPYDISYPINRYCYPMKLFEYFYAGKPVIATPIEELKRFPKYVKLANSSKDWSMHIKYLLNNSWPRKYQTEEQKIAVSNSWENKINAVCSLL